MTKPIKVTLEQRKKMGGGVTYKITNLINAAILRFIGKDYILGDYIESEHVDEFARNDKWDCTIKLGEDLK